MTWTIKELHFAIALYFGLHWFAGSTVIDHFTGPNFALRRPASQTPDDYYDYYASLAVDGNTDNDVGHHSCSHTNGKYNTSASWTVRFREPLLVKGIVIYNRKQEKSDTWPYLEIWIRLKNFKIYGDEDDLLYDDSKYDSYHNSIINVTINSSFKHSSVTIWIPGHRNQTIDQGKSYLTLCEVMVYAETCNPPVNNHVVLESAERYFIVGKNITFYCEMGYRSVGSTSATCIRDMQWSSLPNCSPVHCPDPGTFENGHYLALENCSSRSLSDLFYGCRIQPFCEDGFKLQTQLTRTCDESGNWSTPPPACIIVTCDYPGNISHGQYFKNNSAIYTSGPSNYGTFIGAKCDEGYIINEKRQRTCTKDGKWSGGDPNCNIVNCSFEELGGLTNGHYVLNEKIFENGFANYMDTAGVVCIKGYKPKSDKENATCRSDGTWSSQTSTCVIVACLTPVETDNMKFKTWYNASHRTFSNALPVGAFAEVICQSGDLKNGSRIRQCRDDGTWDGSEPVCDIERKECEMFQTATIGGVVGGAVGGSVIIIIVAVVLFVVIYRKRHAEANSEQRENAAIYTELRKSQLNTTEYGQIFQTGLIQEHSMSTGSRHMGMIEETSLQSSTGTYCNTTIDRTKRK